MLSFAIKSSLNHSFKRQLTTGFRSNNLASTSLSKCFVNLPETTLSDIENGLRIATEDSGLPTATVGIWIDAGARHESIGDDGVLNGSGNVLQHMLFKGTANRNKSQLESEIANMGAYLNAYTTKEHTALFMRCMSKDVEKSVEILADIIQNSKLDENEIDNVRKVVLNQLDEAETNYRQVVFDHLHAIAYQGTSLSLPVLGSSEKVEKIKKQDLEAFIESNFKGPRMVLAGAGGVKHDHLVKLAERHLKNLKIWYEGVEIPVMKPVRYTGSDLRIRDDDMPFAHVAIAIEGPGWEHPDSLVMKVANEVVGCWDRSYGGGANVCAQLAVVAASEKLCHSYEAFNALYKDTSLWGVYYVCERMQLEPMCWNIQDFWMKLCQNITESEVKRAKNRLRAQLLSQVDGPSSAVCDDIGIQVLNHGRKIPFYEIEERLNGINANVVKDVCNKYIYDRCPVVVAVGPTENLFGYERLRTRMWRIRY